MTWIISNKDVARVLTMRDTIAALEASYSQLVTREAVCRPRVDVRIPTSVPGRVYQWGSMEGGSTSGYFALRIKSDIVYEEERDGIVTQEKYCSRPGLFCGLVLLTSVENGEPLAFLNDGLLQHMRVGADAAIGAKLMARRDATVLGVLGSGGMARSHVEALLCVRALRALRVYSPTRAHRERFGSEMGRQYGLDVTVCERPEEVYRGAHIVAAVTDSTVPVLDGSRLEPGTHVINIGGGGKPDAKTLERVDAYLRFGNAPAPVGHPEMAVDDEFLTYAARPDAIGEATRKRGHGVALPDKLIWLADILEGRSPGRSDDRQITWSERGNLQGAQFFAVAGKAYELARAAGLGREIPTEWLLQDIRD